MAGVDESIGSVVSIDDSVVSPGSFVESHFAVGVGQVLASGGTFHSGSGSIDDLRVVDLDGAVILDSVVSSGAESSLFPVEVGVLVLLVPETHVWGEVEVSDELGGVARSSRGGLGVQGESEG